MVGHRQEFRRELEAIEAKVIELFALVAEDLPGATQALLTGDSEVLKVLAERQKVIDALYSEIEQLASRAILLQAPVADDLRFLLSVLQIMPDLDRAHHSVVDRLAGQPHSQQGPVAALPGVGRADGQPRLGHVAPGRGLLVPA
jgi:phosphate uptake regulator